MKDLTDPPARPDETARAHQQAAIASFGVRALGISSVDDLIAEAFRTLTQTLDVELCGLLEATEDPVTFHFRAGLGWHAGVIGATVPAEPGSAVAYMLAQRRPVVYNDLATEIRFTAPKLLLDHGVSAGIGVVVYGSGDRVLGVLGVHTAMVRTCTRAEEEVRERELRFRRLAENAHDVIFRFRIRPEARLEYVNPAIETLFGYSPQECYDDPELWKRLLPEEEQDLSPLRQEQPVELRLLRKDRSSVWCEVRPTVVRDASGGIVAVEGICRDVTSTKLAAEGLRKAYEREHEALERLKGIDQMKDDFLRAISHEVRTPLTSVLGFALTLRSNFESLSPEDRSDLLERLERNARALEQLLTELLDLDRLQRGMVEAVRSPTRVLQAAIDVVAGIDAQGRSIHVEGDDVVADVDAPKTHRILESLLANSIRHTPPDSKAWVRAEAVEGGILLVVEDDGPGIPDHLKEAMFQPFRHGPTVDQHSPGPGIGLSLVTHYAGLHGGWVRALDREGGGARIEVFLAATVAKR